MPLIIKFLISILLGVCLYFYNEVISVSEIALQINLMILLVLITLTFLRSKKGFVFFIIFTMLSDPSSRDLEEFLILPPGTSFLSFNSASDFGAPLCVLYLIIIFLLRLFQGKLHFTKLEFIIISTVFCFLVFQTLVKTAVLSESLSFNFILSDTRLFIIPLLTYFTLRSIFKNMNINYKRLVGLITQIAVIKSSSVIIAVIYDFIYLTPKLTINTLPQIYIPIFFAIVFSYRNISIIKVVYTNILFFCVMRFSRGDIIFFLLDILLLIYINIRMKIKKVAINGILNLSILILALIGVFSYIMIEINPKLFSFVMWKIRTLVDNDGSSVSAGLRIIEFRNIISYDFTRILVGHGLGGYFEFHWFKPQHQLNLSDYSQYQLYEQKFFKPHTFINYMLLKHGIIGLVVYLSMVFDFFRKAVRLSDNFLFLKCLCVAFAPFALNIYWQPVSLIYFIVLYYLVNRAHIGKVKHA